MRGEGFQGGSQPESRSRILSEWIRGSGEERFDRSADVLPKMDTNTHG